ncbi:MAG: DUF484 family protein [Betaproteobacteria bacterium]|nr:DUF484 family protein [Betaproteobacteria bacterium]
MNPEDVANYLQDNPSFFENYAEVLARIQVPHPHGGQAIPLVDRQMLGLREKHRELEAKLAELLQFGEKNDAIGEKMHRLSGALLAGPTRDALLSALQANLKEEFSIPHVALRLWGLPPRELDADREEYAEVTDELKTYAASLAEPYCGANGHAEAASWFGDSAGRVNSVAHIALREPPMGTGAGACVGMLVLGSEDAVRFYADMGTLYLKRLGDLASAGLSRFA